jgi:hypothetical protein
MRDGGEMRRYGCLGPERSFLIRLVRAIGL